MHPATPTLADLLAGYLDRQTDAHASGLGLAEAGEVQPHDATTSLPVEPAAAWAQAVAVLPLLAGQAAGKLPPAPADWPALVLGQPSRTAVPMCLGNYPQQVRQLAALLTAGREAVTVPVPTPAASPALQAWIQSQLDGKSPLGTLLAAAALRLTGELDRAAALLDQAAVPETLRPLLENERASLEWHRGDLEAAARRWQQLPESPAVLFNRGLANLFLGHASRAREEFEKATATLAETSPWHHLGRLYLALAAMRS